MRPDRLTVVVHCQALITGGIESWLLSLVRRLPTIAWRVHCFTSEQNSNVRARLSQHANLVDDWDDAKRGADIVLTATNFAGAFDGPVVAVSHGCGMWTRVRMNQVRDKATHYVAVSKLATRACPDPSTVTVINNGVDLDRCRATVSRAEMRRRWGLNPTDIAVGYVGRLMEDKGIHKVVDAARYYGKQAVAVFVGDHGDAERLRQRCESLGVRCRFPGGIEQVGNAFAAFDVAMALSPEEGFGLSMVEAMAAGCPLVTTNVGIMPEITKRFGRCASVVPRISSGRRLARAINLAIKDKKRTVRAQQVAHEHFDAQRMAADWSDYVHHVTGQAAANSKPIGTASLSSQGLRPSNLFGGRRNHYN